MDSLLQPEMAAKAEQVGVKKARMDFTTMFALAFLAGAFIALGAALATTVAAGASSLPYGVTKLLVGVVFSLGLILVIVGVMILLGAFGRSRQGKTAKKEEAGPGATP